MWKYKTWLVLNNNNKSFFLNGKWKKESLEKFAQKRGVNGFKYKYDHVNSHDNTTYTWRAPWTLVNYK